MRLLLSMTTMQNKVCAVFIKDELYRYHLTAIYSVLVVTKLRLTLRGVLFETGDIILEIFGPFFSH